MEAISKEDLDRLLTAMLQGSDGISDLLFIAGKPPQMEIHGRLTPCTSEAVLTSAHIQGLAKVIINDNPRLIQDLNQHGSCDCSYALHDSHRFRVNIYRQNGNHAMVLRRLQSQIPT